jgi:signal transduction histidine kinase/PAS domain-containing protein
MSRKSNPIYVPNLHSRWKSLKFLGLFGLILVLMGCSPISSSTTGSPGLELSLWQTDQNQLSMSEALAGYPLRFKALPESDLSFGYSKSDFWFFVKIRRGQPGETVFLEIGYPLLDIVDVHILKDGVVSHSFFTGDHRKFSSRPLETASAFTVPVQMNAKGEGTMLVKIRSSGTVQVPMKVWQAADYHAQDSLNRFLSGLFFGSIASIMLYNLFICVSMRSFTYLLYVGNVFAIMNLYLVMQGLAFQLLWRNHPEMVDVHMLCAAVFSEAFVTAFSVSFLKIKGSHPRLYRATLAFSLLVCFLPLLLLVMPYHTLVKPIVALAFLMVCFSLGMGIWRLMQGLREAYYYVFSWSVFITGTLLYALANFGIIPSNELTKNSMQFGSFWEIMVLSLALADRLNGLTKENIFLVSQLREYITKIEVIVGEKTRSIRSILQSIPLGVLTVNGKELVTGEEYSRHLPKIFARDLPVGNDALHFLFQKSLVNRDSISTARNILLACMDESSLAFDLNAHNLIKEAVIQHADGTERIIELTWTAMETQEGVVDKILVICRDVTEIRMLEANEHKMHQETRMIQELLAQDENCIRDFYYSMDNSLDACQAIMNAPDPISSTQLRTLKINVHTLKGASRTLKLSYLSESTHDFESCLASFQEWDKDAAQQSFQGLLQIYAQYRNINQTKLNRSFHQSDRISLNRHQSESLRTLLHKLQVEQNPVGSDSNITDILTILDGYGARHVRETFAEIHNTALSISLDLNKADTQFEISMPEALITNETYWALKKALLHLLRNSLDHGIESPTERVQAMKPAFGKISISGTVIGGELAIRFSDDGRGLNLMKIHNLALQKGLSISTAPEPKDLAAYIFEDGFSTATDVSHISGRGIGMSAVKEFIESVGGRIELSLGEDKGNGYRAIEFAVYVPVVIEQAA